MQSWRNWTWNQTSEASIKSSILHRNIKENQASNKLKVKDQSNRIQTIERTLTTCSTNGLLKQQLQNTYQKTVWKCEQKNSGCEIHYMPWQEEEVSQWCLYWKLVGETASMRKHGVKVSKAIKEQKFYYFRK